MTLSSPICPKCKIPTNRNYEKQIYECPVCGYTTGDIHES